MVKRESTKSTCPFSLSLPFPPPPLARLRQGPDAPCINAVVTATTTQQPPDEATLAAQRKAYLLRQYALVEDSNSNFASPFADGSSSGGPAPGPGDPGYKGGKDKTEVSPEQLEAEMKRMAMKKKQKAKLKEDGLSSPLLSLCIQILTASPDDNRHAPTKP